jgi:acid phosphatase
VRGRSTRACGVAVLTAALAVAPTVAPAAAGAARPADPLALCGNPGPAPSSPQHVVVVMMENLSYTDVVGSANAPFQSGLANQCGVATSYFGATHTSAANYLAVSAGEYPAKSTPGCGSVASCSDASDNLYRQLDAAGSTWGGFIESMPTACDPTSSGAYTSSHDLYTNGHNPIIFYTDVSTADCRAHDLGVPDLTAQSGPFWDDLQNQTLPAFSFVTPNAADDDEGKGSRATAEQAGDAWLRSFLGVVQQSASYQAGNTLVLVSYDEGEGPDYARGEDCTNTSRDLPVTNGVSAHQDSCHVPLFVVYPYTPAGDHDAAFLDHYSITKTVEQLFGLPYLAHAGDAQTTSLVGRFGIPSAAPDGPPPTVAITAPADGSSVSGQLSVTGTADDSGSDGAGVSSVRVSVDTAPAVVADGTATWTTSIDTTALTNGPHTITAQATGTDGQVGTASVTVAVDNAAAPSSCPAPPAGASELSANVSLETDQSGWTGKYNANSHPTRVAPAGGSYDGEWAVEIVAKAAGTAGLNNANPMWVPGSPGPSTRAGQVYAASAFVRGNVAGERVSLMLRETTPGGSGVSYHTTTTTLTDTSWHEISSAYTAKSSGDLIRYSLYASNLASASQSFLADCLSLQTP